VLSVVSSNPVHSEGYSSSVPDHCFVCLSSTYGFRLPLWFPQTRLVQLSETRAQNNISWSFFCSVISIERWLFFFDDIDEIAGLPGAVVVIIVW
jgi:hypothetical protein